eukprot:TRINITY_DN19469_c0_g2_i1.p1 TRINITY_DN19469_c0_g2~~TRINITY_DN19469_c0_g2_i1.p1  ORF type:complete len:1658 (+),score=455.73 TRINITY_DN19469_c0_g2_i1:49-5022(+)
MAVSARSHDLGTEARSSFGYPPQVLGQEANWQKQFEGLERQETELQQSQSRLMKEQTATMSRDLSGLRQEVLSLKLASTAVKADAAAALDARALELRELLCQERREREAAQAAWKEQLTHMERSLLQRRQEDFMPLGRQVNDLEAQLQEMMAALEGKLRQECQHLESGFQERHGQLQKELEKERNLAFSALEQQTRQLQDRLSQQEILQSELKRELQLSQDKLQREVQAQCGELQSLIAQHTEEAGLASQDEASQREQQLSGLGGRIEEVEQEVRGRASARLATLELELGKLTGSVEGESIARQEQCKSLWSKMEEALAAQLTTVRTQLDKLEDSQVTSSANIEKVLDASSQSLTRRIETSEEAREKSFHELGASLGDLIKQKTVLLQRLDSLEESQGSTLERQAKDLAGLVGEVQAAREAQSEAIQRLQQSVAQAEARHAEEICACQEQAAARLRESEVRQAAALADLSKEAEKKRALALEAVEATKTVGTETTATMQVLEKQQHMLQEEQHMLQNQFEQLRKAVRESSAQQAEFMSETKGSVKAIQGWLGTSEEDIKLLKHTQERVVSDLTSCKIGLDACHSELGKTLEKALARLGDLEADESVFRSELELLRSRHSSLDAAERAVEESLQVALAKLSVCEASERSMDEKIKSQGEQLRSLAGMSSLESQVQRLAGELGACEAEVTALSQQGAEDRRCVKEQCDLIKQHLQTIKDQQTKAQSSSSSSLDAVNERLDEQSTSVKSLQNAHEALRAEHASLDSRCSALNTSIQGVSASQKLLEEAAKAAGARQTQAVEEHARQLNEVWGSIKAVEDRHSELHGKFNAHGQRLGTLEQNLGEHARRQDAMWLEAGETAQKAHDALETSLKEDIAAVKAQLLAEGAEHMTRIERLAREQDEFDERHSSSLERMASLEKAQLDEAKLRSEAISDLRSAQAGQTQQLEALDRANQIRIERFETRASGEWHKEDFQHLQRLLDAERSAREAELEGLREQVTCEEETREQSVAKLQERCRAFERSLEQTKQENARTREEHGRLVDRHTSVSEKLAFVETKGGLIDDAHEKLDELKRRITRCEQHGDWIGDIQRAQASLESDRTSLESDHELLRGRVLELDRRLQEATEAHAKTTELLRSDAARFSSQAKVQDSNQASLAERLDRVESSVVPAVEGHTRELSETSLKFERLQGRLAACEKLGQSFGEELQQVQAKSREAVLAAEKEVQDRFGSLEQGNEQASEEQRRELERVNGRMEQLETRLVSCERLTGPTLTDIQTLQARWPAEKASLESHLSSLRDRLDELEPSLGELSSGQAKTLDFVRADLEQLRGRVSAAEQQQASAHGELRRLLDAELAGAQAALRERLGETLQQLPMLSDRLDESWQQLDALRGRQEDHRRVVETLQAAHAQLAGDLSDAASRSGQLATLLAQEQESRVTQDTEIQRNLTQLEAQVSTELGKQSGAMNAVKILAEEARPQLQKLGDEVREQLGELTGRIDPLELQLKAQHESIEGRLETDRRERELKEVAAEERLECERGARELQRRELAGLVARERQVTERLTIVERSVTAVDELARREIEARARESRRIWDALDNHTHDLSTQVVENFGGMDDDKSYETFPCQPLTKLLRLGNARGADFPLPKGDASAETRTPPSRRVSDRGS